MRKYTPGLIPWIALLILLYYMTGVMERMVDHLSLMELDIMELQMDVYDEEEEEEEEFLPEYEPGEVPERLRIAATRFSYEKG